VPAKNENGNEGESNIGVLKLKLGDELIINDGQHRCAGIASALKENPQIGDHTIAVLLFNYESKERVQQMFSDLNRYVVKTSKSLDILYDKRDKISVATIAFLDQVPLFQKLTEKDDASLKSKSPKLFTLAALYDANRELLKGREQEGVIDNAALLNTYWGEVAKHMPDWNSVFTEHKTAVELRAEKIASHSTVLRALGGLGAELMKEENWRERLANLDTIDWSKQNKDWENVCIIANSVVSNRQARAATKAYIKAKLEMELTDGEKRALDKQAA
jgi:DNA sulfur modification protein DndB